MKYFLALCIPMGLCLAGFGVTEIAAQHRKITRCQPVRATIVASDVEPFLTKTYKPVIRYKYQVDDRDFSSGRVFPTDPDGDASWAHRVAVQFEVGSEVDAWCNPDNPREAFLLRHYVFEPYGLVLIGLGFSFGALVGALYSHRESKGPPTPRELPDGWYQLDPPGTLPQAVRTVGIGGAAWQLLGGAAWGHFFWVADRPYDTEALWGTAVWIAIGLAALGIAAHAWWLNRWMDDACVLISQPKPETGQSLFVRVEQKIHKPALIRKLRVELTCSESKWVWAGASPVEAAKKVFTIERTALEGHAAQAGEVLAADFELPIPADSPATRAKTWRNRTGVVWKLHQSLRLVRMFPYTDAFVLVVDKGPEEEEPMVEVEVLEDEA